MHTTQSPSMVLWSQQRSLQLAPSKEILDNKRSKHGNDIEEYWNKEFGYGISELTHSEAEHVRSIPNAHSLRTRITQAKYVGGIQLDEGAATPEEQKAISLARITKSLQENHHPKAIIRTERRTAPCRGLIVAETDDFIIQQVNDGSRYFQAHKKEDLPNIPKIGDKPTITYSTKEPLAKIREPKRSLSR